MRKRGLTFGVLIVLLITIIVCMGIGTYQISPKEIIEVFIGRGTAITTMTILDLRLPRIALAIAAAAALSVSGSILQSLTQNDLAEPGIMGINAGASLAVVLVINAGGAFYYNALSATRMFFIPFAAILGGLMSASIIYNLSRHGKRMSKSALVLLGIGVNAGLNAVITFYQLRMSKGDYNQVLTWISGSLWGSSWAYFLMAGPAIAVLIGITIYKCKTLDLFDLGDELAIGLGVDIQREYKIFFCLAVGLAALSTAVVGNLIFVGLLGPHIAKHLVGPAHRKNLPLAIIINSIIVIVADTISRNAFSPLEIPVGIMISMIGVPYFIYLMRKEG